tara:strand:+ start:409 stop:531 length:123 start_codon:yes stop_codon:yes gene_type:complete
MTFEELTNLLNKRSKEQRNNAWKSKKARKKKTATVRELRT